MLRDDKILGEPAPPVPNQPPPPVQCVEAPASLVPSVNSIFTNWKSTIKGFLTVTLVTTSTLLPLKVLTPEQMLWAGAVQALAIAYISLIQKDTK
jgi:hypothetical protein